MSNKQQIAEQAEDALMLAMMRLYERHIKSSSEQCPGCVMREQIITFQSRHIEELSTRSKRGKRR